MPGIVAQLDPRAPHGPRRGPLGRGPLELLWPLLALACAPLPARPRPPTAAPAPAAAPSANDLAPPIAPGPSPPPGAEPPVAAGPATLPDPSLPPSDPEARLRWLQDGLDALLGGVGRDPPSLPGARVSAVVLEPQSGRVLYQRNPDLQLNAASNVKLVTAAAALSALGPEYRFRTTLAGPPRGAGAGEASAGRPASVQDGRAQDGRYLGPGGVIDGDLYARGGGDPTLTADGLDALARQLAALGVRHVTGDLVIDDGLLGPEISPPRYDDKEESGAFRAPSAATSLHANAVAITVVPGPAAGAPARVTVTPASAYVRLSGRVLTADLAAAGPRIETRGEPAPAVATASADDDLEALRTVVELSGRVRLGAEPRTYLRRIAHPHAYFGHTLRATLAARGVRIAGRLRRGASPPGARVLATHESPALGIVVHELNKQSNNFFAEQLLRVLGAETLGPPGSFARGTEAIARYLDGLGIPPGSYRMDNGAGLYDSNRFSAAQLATVLRAATRDFRIASELVASLALAGSDGTLAARMVDTPAARRLRGKTGTLLGTSCLSGLVGAPGREPLVFSLLMNQVADTAQARAVQDRAGALLALYLDPELAARDALARTGPPAAEPAPP